jgi:Nucleotidyltransferase domain
MDLGDPTRSIVPTLDGPVLAVLARSGRPLTVGEVTAQTARGSEIGVRRCLARLVGQGIVLATEMGRNRVHELNQNHVAAPIAIALSDLRVELWNRMRKDLNSWRPKPLYACVFGSAARGDGGTESDIDLLIIHPPFPGDPKPPRRSSLLESVAAAIAAPVPASPTEAKRWPRYIDQLRDSVQKWSGNVLQVVDLSFAEWVGMQQSSELGQEIKRDSIELIGKLKL